MRIRAIVSDVNGEKLGPGPVTLESASARTTLDQIGTFNLSVPLTDDRAREWFTVEKRVSVYREQPGKAPHTMFSGVIDSVTKRSGANGWSLDVSGNTLLMEMTYKSTLLNRRFGGSNIYNIINALIALVPGWSVDFGVTPAVSADARFDGANVFKAIASVVSKTPYHLRQGEGRLLEVGAFGEDLGLVLTNSTPPNPRNTSIAFIETLQVLEESTKIVNWVVPIGGGEGEAATTLEYSTRDFVQTMTGPDNRPLRYISNPASIALYGQREEVWVYKEIAPISNSIAGKTAASNQIADATYADLQKTGESQITYSITLRKVEKTLKVGDVVRVLYTGPIKRADGKYLPGDKIDQYFFVTRIIEKANGDGATYDLEVSNVQRPRKDPAGMVAAVLDEATVRNYRPQPSAYTFQDSKTDTTVNSTNVNIPVKPAVYRFEIDSSVTSLTKATLRIRSLPLYGLTRFNWTSTTASNNFNYFTVQNDTRYPVSLTVTIDGVDYTAQFNGPFNAGNNISFQVDVSLDITDILNSGTVYGVHTVEVQTGYIASFPVGFPGEVANPTISNYAHGLIEFTLNAQGVCQAIL